MLKLDEYPNREAFGRAVCRIMERKKNVIAIAADTNKWIGLGLAMKAFPNRVLNVGIAEQNMINMAAGMASLGNLVFVGTYGPFATLRVMEQIRSFICYPNLNVKILGGSSGLSNGMEGVTHQGLEDIALMRILPNMTVLVPADSCSTEIITEEIVKHNGPAYIRFGFNSLPKIFDFNYRFVLGKANFLREGTDVTIICNGAMVSRTLLATEQLANDGIKARVLEMPCVKPIDVEAIVKCASDTRAIVTTEEHSIIGGLGSAVAEVLSEVLPIPLVRVGIKDVFTEAGEQNALMDEFGMAIEDVVNAAKKAIQMKISLNPYTAQAEVGSASQC
jgi:transketolase